ncbi:carbohydrate porin [Agaribacterium sp. ZY112]|uniref:carbohydrate porin n=1 Tax=Agaribacterium sp. ZY112 TaxID=3233574 RepID=UPI003524DB0C
MLKCLVAGSAWLILVMVSLECLSDDAGHSPHKAGYAQRGSFSGPGSVDAELEEEDRFSIPHLKFESMDKALEPWFAMKAHLYQDSGFKFGVYYNALYQHASATLPTDDSSGIAYKDEAASGIFRINGALDLVGRDSSNVGTLYFNVDNRHTLGSDIAPAGIANEVGYVGHTGVLFSDSGTVLVDLNYQQRINGGRGGFIVGRFDPNDYVFVSGYANPWTAFQNVATLLNPAVALPDSSWGLGAGHWLNDHVYILGTINDANGTVSDNLEFFEGGAEFWKAVEFGWAPSSKERFQRQFNISMWQVDAREDISANSSEGIAISANWLLANNLMPIFRAGWSQGSAPIYNKTITAGLTYKLVERSDDFGVALNWGQPALKGLEDQLTAEVFYKYQLAQNIALTPSLQLLQNPALNPDENSVVIAALRFRLSL